MPGVFLFLVFICELSIHTVVFGNEVDYLVRQWAPRVWLAPGENFKPSNVETFLDNVCVADENRKCIFPKLNSDISLSSTEAWSLNTVQPIEALLDNTDSFLYGKNTIQNSVPTYAVVKHCEPEKLNFHVRYWFFYPYNKGKDVCEIGGIPNWQIGDTSLCSWKSYGNHVGDWERMTLWFDGNNFPKSAYLAAHKSGAYYIYNEGTGNFQFDHAEESEGINQTPEYPPYLHTQDNHPIVFSAKGSHGTWAAPGEYQYNTVPKLVDKTGYGVPWNTWNNVEIYHLGLDSLPYWIRFRGRWGNPKKNCLLFGELEMCEYSDGPEGILRQSQDYNCP
ncbi:unnamed protein product [Psylliodes chrysocephalus]|uniref:Vacuolar protein sorting-associated protein 62 n=1 Tax=Psylliodes chrysocephalus TaxID=3402493 RepID=A0A9P0D369_9CUCU|nr:unnamed protein product [Psylliodes chrysocephala]